jgi:hypothetical protein
LISAGLLQSRQPTRRRRGHLVSLLVAVSCLANCTPKTLEEQEREKDVAFARSCVAVLSARDPKADARTAFAAGDGRLLAFSTGEIVVDTIALGVGCFAKDTHFRPRALPELPLNHMITTDVPGDYETSMKPCFDANETYGSAFNHEMVRLAPDAIERSCVMDSSGSPELSVAHAPDTP